MPVIWRLQELLAVEKKIIRPSQLRTALLEEAGYEVALQTAINLLKGPPRELRFKTTQAICDAFGVHLVDFCQVRPSDTATREVNIARTSAARPYRPRSQEPPSQTSESPYPDPAEYLQLMEELDEKETA